MPSHCRQHSLIHSRGAAKAEKDNLSQVDPPDGLQGLAMARQAEESQWWGDARGWHVGNR